ncbi:hypothetical protein JI739_04290 [Ramlibacter sp. AW1]|uniref:Uncharacterized protein n=1 Tax=Ramlibacter aurantiacus TaxID=2801330 RepID=A0A936ZFZ5_9BURK|nr:hypothetical protein [Ramlibacter aurantiacus]MBL0419563.1 hypothetical protein [Ramlibacter aurantiacus]
MSSHNNADSVVFAAIADLIKDKTIKITEDMPLIGGDGLLNSMQLVELCLSLEDKAAEMGFEFDWTSDAAMSRSRSMFRTAGALTEEFRKQMDESR